MIPRAASWGEGLSLKRQGIWEVMELLCVMSAVMDMLLYAFVKIHRTAHQKKVNFTVYNFFFVFCIFRATPMAYSGSQARHLIRATAAGLHYSHSHSKARSEPCLRPTPQLTAIPYP